MATPQINVPKLGIFLGTIAAIAAGLLSVVDAATKPQIEARKKAAMTAAMKQVLPGFDNDPGAEKATFQAANGWDVTYFTARSDGEIVGYAGSVDNPDEGFSGTISLMVGLAPDGSVRNVISDGKTNSAVIVTAQTETPGLGTSITDRKVQKTIFDLFKGEEQLGGLVSNKYLDWYAGKKASDERWPIVKEGAQVNGKTGATITSAAIGGAVHAIGKTAIDNLDQLSQGAE